MQIASGIAYYHYISGRYFIDPWGEDSVHIAAVIVVVVLAFLFTDIMKAEHTDLKATAKEIEKEIKELRN